jgi:hypothetical protein
MRCTVVAFTVGLWVLDLTPSVAQSTTRFGTCAYWQDNRESGTDAFTKQLHSMYRLGVAHGFALGTGADIRSFFTGGDAPPKDVLDIYATGIYETFRFPALLDDAFNLKCADYRNRGVSLTDLGFLIILEVGGLPMARSERALEAMRTRDDNYRDRVVRAVMGVP